MILEIAASFLAVAVFSLALWWLRIMPIAHYVLKTTMAGLSAMMDSELDDDAKEIAARRAGLGLIGASFSIFVRFAVALVAAALPIYLADVIGLVSREAIFALMLRLDYIVIVSVILIVLTGLARRRYRVSYDSAPQTNRYSTADRFFHAIAFSSPAILKTASLIEDRLLSKSATEPGAPPIFITSLARGGTTALLNAFHSISGVATHKYRDMPFLTAPGIWNQLAGGKRRSVKRHQRAHGDGLEIDLDSPEAFEEVIWKMFWPEKFRGDSIVPWGPEDRKAEAEQFFKRHMMKIIRVRQTQGEEPAEGIWRYCSKNNANIARILHLKETFPGSQIIVPIRRPESHAASMLRQHENFLKLQAQDEFIQRYMRDIGHFEFGRIHKPIQFPGFDTGTYDPATPDYWLAYWVAAFAEALKHSDHCFFVLQDDLRSAPNNTMTRLCETLGLPHEHPKFSSYFHSYPDQTPCDQYDPRLFSEAQALYRELEGCRL